MIGAQVVVRERVPDAVAALDLDGRVALAAESALAARDVLDAGGADRRDLTRVEVLPEVLAEVRHVFPTALLTIRYFSKTRFTLEVVAVHRPACGTRGPSLASMIERDGQDASPALKRCRVVEYVSTTTVAWRGLEPCTGTPPVNSHPHQSL